MSTIAGIPKNSFIAKIPKVEPKLGQTWNQNPNYFPTAAVTKKLNYREKH